MLFTFTEARMLIRDGDGTKEWRLDRGYRLKKTGKTVDRRQNNGNVKAVSPRHCAATCAPRNCCFSCRAWTESQRQCPLHCCWGTTWSERSPTFAVQLHLPPLDLAWNTVMPPGVVWMTIIQLIRFVLHSTPYVSGSINIKQLDWKAVVSSTYTYWRSVCDWQEYFICSSQRSVLLRLLF